MKNPFIPPNVYEVLNKIELSGFEAFLVGGCVRDLIRGKTPHDYDITSSATPEEIMSIFPKSHPTGIAHGTVTVVSENMPLEITTFRTEGEYLDSRHPSAVFFVRDIKEDLMRRDFTMNAIAMTKDFHIVDPFCGEKDIENKLIVCVGNAEKRFCEDALRMFRALRFKAQLGFEIEKNTFAAIKKLSYLSKNIAIERICQELNKLLLSENPELIETVIKLGLLDHVLIKNKEIPSFIRLKSSNENLISVYSIFSNILINSGLIEDEKEFLKSLKLDKNTIKIASTVSKLMNSEEPKSKFQMKLLLKKYSLETLNYYSKLQGSNISNLLTDLINSKEAYSIPQLAISGEDLKNLGYKGKEIGDILEKFLNLVIENPELNQKTILLKMLRTED